MSKARRELEKRATREMLIHSFLDWKSAIVLALTIIMSFATWVVTKIWPLPPWTIAIWPTFGLLGEIALAWGNLNDPNFGQKVVAAMLRDEFNSRRLKDGTLRKWIDQALDYRGRIESNIRETRDGSLKDELLNVAAETEAWINNVYHIAKRLDDYRQDPIIRRDRETVPIRITNLRKQLAQEKDAALYAQIQTTLQNQQILQDHLNRLERSMNRASLQLESTLSALGTVYSQTLLIEAKDIDSGRARRLRQDISDQVTELEDMLTVMDEVYLDASVAP